MSTLIAPNGLTTAHRPIIWRMQQDGSVFPNISFARALVYVNGAVFAELVASPYPDDDYPGFYNFEFDVSGLLLQSFLNPQKPTDTINYEFGYQVAFTKYSTDMIKRVYLSVEYISIDSLNQEVIDTDEDTIEIAVVNAKVQTQERTILSPYRFSLGMKPLTYVRFGNAVGDDENMPSLEYYNHGAYLSFLFDGGLGVPFVSFQLRDGVVGSGGNWYGTGLARLAPPVQFRNLVTVSISPQNILSYIFDSTTTTPNFLANLANVNAGWDRIGIAFGLAIPLGGGNYQHITYGSYFYKVEFRTCKTLAVYARNPLGGFDATRFAEALSVRSMQTTGSRGILPQKFDMKTIGLPERYRATYRGEFKYGVQVSASVKLSFELYSGIPEARAVWSLLQTEEAYVENEGLPEYVDDTNLEPTRFLPIVIEDGSIETKAEYDDILTGEIIFKPANAYY